MKRFFLSLVLLIGVMGTVATGHVVPTANGPHPEHAALVMANR